MLPAADTVSHTDNHAQLIAAALLGIASIIVLIVWRKMHPFLALTLGSAVLAVVAGIPLADTFTAFTKGMGSTIGDVGTLIAFGAIIGRLLIDSGGADQIVDTVLARTPGPRLPWAMALIAFVIGIPLFFEVGIVLLIPVVMIVARRAHQSLILLGVPALAGLSALHGLVPPHPRTAHCHQRRQGRPGAHPRTGAAGHRAHGHHLRTRRGPIDGQVGAD